MIQFCLEVVQMNRLKELRKEKGLTQEELAKELGTTKLTISNWENEKYLIRNDKAKVIADYFQVWTPYLLGESKIRTESKAIQFAELNRKINKSFEDNPPVFEMTTKKPDEHELLYFYGNLKEPFKNQVRIFTKNMWELQKDILKNKK